MVAPVKFSLSMILGVLYVLSELWLALTRRSGGSAVSHDRKSLFVLWTVIAASILLGVQATQWLTLASMPHVAAVRCFGVILFAAGLALRWSSIRRLGKFFTVDVALHQDHQLVETGPYRLVRHPSYTGALLAFAGLGFCIGNWGSLIIFVLPISLAFLLRIHVEECALVEAFGERYQLYQCRTKRLIPFVY